MIPDSPSGSFPGPPQFPYDIPKIRGEIVATIDECAAVADRLTGQLRAIVDDCLRSCGGVWANCESCISGLINERLSRAGIVATKCVGKIADRAQMLFNQAELLASPVIGQIPELRDIVAQKMLGIDPGNPDRRDVPPPDTGRPGQPPPVPPSDPGRPPTIPPPPIPPEPFPPTPPRPPVSWPCPPGTRPIYDQVTGDQIACEPIPGLPKPPAPPTCDVEFPTCPPGFEAVVDPVTNQYYCKPVEPTCPPPEVKCPPGQTWRWDGQKWSCQPEKTGGGGGGGGGTICEPAKPIPSIMDWAGFPKWNSLVCPDLESLQDDQTLEKVLADWDEFVLGLFQPFEAKLGCQGKTFFDSMLYGAFGLTIDFVKLTIKWIGDQIIRWFFRQKDCNYLLIVAPALMRAIVSFVEHWFDVGLDDLITNLSYSISRACPTFLPSQPGVDAAYLRAEISLDTWKCWTRANNNLDVPAAAIVHAQRTQLNHEQWTVAWMRGLLTQEQWRDKLRGVGVLDDSDAGMIRKILDYIPGPSDLIRFMLRDVEDAGIVEKYDLDAEFENKYTGLLRSFADAQGVDEQTMRRYWRAHWDWPSPTQLYTMLQRLRPDSLEESDRKIAITLKDVVQVLGVKDVIPVWRERLAAISFRLPRKTDAYKLFKSSLWGVAQMVDYYQNYGYQKKTAEALAEEDSRRKAREYEKAAAIVTKASVNSAFVAGAIDQQFARVGFRKAGLDEFQTNLAMEHAVYLKEIAQRKRLKSAIKCRFTACELSKDSAVAALVNIGWDATDAIAEVTCWKQQCEVKGKEATTAQLCEWYGLGLLTASEYRTRLRRLGWSTDDAGRIIGVCEDDLRKAAEKSERQRTKEGSKNGKQ